MTERFFLRLEMKSKCVKKEKLKLYAEKIMLDAWQSPPESDCAIALHCIALHCIALHCIVLYRSRTSCKDGYNVARLLGLGPFTSTVRDVVLLIQIP